MAQDDALAFAASAQHHQRFARPNVQIDAAEHGFAVEAFAEPAHADVGTRLVVHPIAMNSLVRKKSETSTPIDAATTAEVVARPTPSAPPVADRPFAHAIIAISKPKNTDLPSPLIKSPSCAF